MRRYGKEIRLSHVRTTIYGYRPVSELFSTLIVANAADVRGKRILRQSPFWRNNTHCTASWEFNLKDPVFGLITSIQNCANHVPTIRVERSIW